LLNIHPRGFAEVAPKVMKNGSCSATTLSGSASLPFVVSTGAQRSGEISVWMLFLGNVFLLNRATVSRQLVQRLHV
jgi:hypothetical protein